MAEADIETARHLTFEDLASTEPYHLAEIRYYTPGVYVGDSIEEYRLIYYLEKVLWKDHAWGISRSWSDFNGAPFQDQWTIEVRPVGSEHWKSDGRLTGWSRSQYYGFNRCYTLKAAIELALQKALKQRAEIERNLAKANEIVRDLSLQLAALA